MTKDIQNSKFDKAIIDMIATTIQDQMSLPQVDSMFQEAEENLEAICQNPRINLMVGERAAELLGKMTTAQKTYDSYFGKGRFNESEIPIIKRPLAYQLAAYTFFIQQNQSVLKEARIIFKKNYDKTQGLGILEMIPDTSIGISPEKTIEQKMVEPNKWIYT